MRSSEYLDVHFERGELRIPEGATADDIAQALGEAYEAGHADFLTQLYHLFFRYDQENGASNVPPLEQPDPVESPEPVTPPPARPYPGG
ncbi:MAG: hypothetical protein AAFV29_25610 [Myxococcota bacterium]